MKKKINMFLLGIGALTITLAIGFSVVAFYELFKTEVFENLKTCTNIIKHTELIEDLEYNAKALHIDNMRLTVIATDGTVLFDDDADVVKMDNHMDRPEVAEAFETGEGMAVRTSSTMKKSTFYYAERLDDGSVLRIAKETGSIWSVFGKVIPIMLCIATALFVICMLLSKILVKSFVKPIEQLAENIDGCSSISAYVELVPFINKINQQHEDILKNARLRQEFTANVSHELKTPLTSISGYSELIESGMTNEEDVVRFASEIHRNSDRLLTMINDIIKLSELDSSGHEIPFENVDLLEIAQNCVSLLQVSAENNNVSLNISGEHCLVHANVMMMEELVYNLCDNAIRYNVANGIVNVSITQTAENVILTVADNGIGISKENQERIFERFYRVDKSRSKSTGGTGLGLAIVKHIVVQNNARMELESEIGSGTKIRILFPKY